MAWDWVSFIVGVAVGAAVMWIAAVVSALGEKDDREEHWR